MTKLLELILAPLSIVGLILGLLNLVGGIVAGIWLLVLGEWNLFLVGIAVVFVGAFAASLLLAPGMLVAGASIAALDKGKTLIGWPLLMLSSAWTYAVVIAWGVGSFLWFGERVDTDNAIPVWLWSYGAASGVWAYMASKEPEGSAAPITAFAAQLGYIVLSICVIGLGWDLGPAIVAMSVPFLIPVLASIGLALEQRQRSSHWN